MSEVAPDRPESDPQAMHAPIDREYQEPREGHEPVPMWLIVVFGLLVFWGGWYVATYNGGWRGDVMDERPADRFAGMARPGAAAGALAPGRQVYQITAGCVACHQSNGRGYEGQIPPLAGSEWVLGEPARLKRIVLHGIIGPMNVGGRTYNNEMPAFFRLSDQQIADVLTYIRGNPLWGNSAPPIPPESVAATREATRQRNRPYTQEELLAVTADDYTPPATQPATIPSTRPTAD